METRSQHSGARHDHGGNSRRLGHRRFPGALHRGSADAARLQLNLFNLTHGSPARGCAPGKGELMPQSIPLMAARLQRDVPTAESKVDDAIIALSIGTASCRERVCQYV